MRPDDLLGDVEAERVSPDVLAVTLSAPSDAEAVRRLSALTSIYLTFRAEQLTLQSQVLVKGMQERIDKLQSEVAQLSRQIELLSAADKPSASRLSDTISQRAYAEAKIESLQQSVEDVTLRSASIVSSSMVVDPATADTGSAKRRTALVLATGLIAGFGLGCGVVLFVAITSDRLRRRSDVANALGVPVSVSVRRVAPLRKGWRWLPPLWIVDRRRADERARLAHTIVEELLPHRRGRLAVAGIDNSDEVGFAVAAAAVELVERGCSITVIDLTKRGSRGLRALTPSMLGTSDALTLLRPRVLPALARHNVDLLEVGRWDEGDSTPTPQLTDAILVLSDIEPAVGAYHLSAWTERVIVAVTAGRSSAERVRTVGDLVRTAGLDLRFAAVLHTERTDDSLGEARFEAPHRRKMPRTTTTRNPQRGSMHPRRRPVCRTTTPRRRRHDPRLGESSDAAGR